VEHLYQNSRPLHHQDSASSLEYVPQSGASAFFVTTIDKLEKLDGEQVQAIFRCRNILISGPAPKDFRFDSQGLANLGPLNVERAMQGIYRIPNNGILASHIFLVGSLRFDSGDQPMLRIGTLADLLVKDKRGEPRVLNMLDLPMGGATVPMPAHYRCVILTLVYHTPYFNSVGI
jgi:hypothetical protein